MTDVARLERENRWLRSHWESLARICADCHVENDEPDRVKWEGEWHTGPAATAMNSMMRSLKKLCASALSFTPTNDAVIDVDDLLDCDVQLPGVDGAEPCLRHILIGYYRPHFSEEEAADLAHQYISALRRRVEGGAV